MSNDLPPGFQLEDLPQGFQLEPVSAPTERAQSTAQNALTAPPRTRPDPLAEATPRNVARSVLEIAKGAVGGTLGLPGEIETAARTAWANRGLLSNIRAPAQRPAPSTLPTPERVERSFFGRPSGAIAEGMREVGRFLGPSAASKVLGTAGRVALGTPSQTTEELARAAERRGFTLEPMQTRQDTPMGSPGAFFLRGRNQRLANEEVTAATGQRSAEISTDFLNNRVKALGQEYDRIFNRPIRVDRPLVTELEAMRDFETAVRPAMAQSVSPAAQNIIARYQQASQGVGGNVTRFSVDGRELQALRSEMSNIARTSSDGATRYRAGEFVKRIDDSIARAHPDLAADLQRTNRQYAATKTLEDLMEARGIVGGNVSLERLGNRLAGQVYGFGSGTDNHPLSEIGRLGRELKMRGRFEGAESPTDLIGATTSRLGRALGVATRMPGARSLQRSVNEPSRVISPLVAGETAAVGAGELAQELAPPMPERRR